MTDPKDTKLTVMVSEPDLAMLKHIAEADDVSASHVIRMLIRKEYRARTGEPERVFIKTKVDPAMRRKR
jgi:hypothetical protein